MLDTKASEAFQERVEITSALQNLGLSSVYVFTFLITRSDSLRLFLLDGI